MKVDLHGYTLNDAHIKIMNLVDHCYETQDRKLIVITGRSGQINREFPFWLENPSISHMITDVSIVRPGAWQVSIKRKR